MSDGAYGTGGRPTRLREQRHASAASEAKAGSQAGPAKTATVLDRMRWAIKVRVGLPRFAPDPPGRQEPPQKGPRNARMAREIAVELAKAASSCPADAVAVPPE
jgi:hypothetical protein